MSKLWKIPTTVRKSWKKWFWQGLFHRIRYWHRSHAPKQKWRMCRMWNRIPSAVPEEIPSWSVWKKKMCSAVFHILTVIFILTVMANLSKAAGREMNLCRISRALPSRRPLWTRNFRSRMRYWIQQLRYLRSLQKMIWHRIILSWMKITRLIWYTAIWR